MFDKEHVGAFMEWKGHDLQGVHSVVWQRMSSYRMKQ